MDTGRSARPFGANVPSRTTSSPTSGWKDVAAPGLERPALQHRLVQLDGAVRDRVPAEFAHSPLPAG